MFRRNSALAVVFSLLTLPALAQERVFTDGAGRQVKVPARIDDKIIVGFDETKIRKALGL